MILFSMSFLTTFFSSVIILPPSIRVIVSSVTVLPVKFKLIVYQNVLLLVILFILRLLQKTFLDFLKA